MNCFRFFTSKKAQKQESAGCFFTDERHVLAGYQANKKVPTICGIGGKIEGESPHYAAIRETLEELFHIQPPSNLILSIMETLPPKHTIVNDSYHIFVYSFIDLQTLLDIVASYKISSPLFYTAPKDIFELVSKRKIESSCEISHLALVPFVKNPVISKFLSSDMALIRAQIN